MKHDKHDSALNAEAFILATQIYVRLRRVSDRIIDAKYLVENKGYAKHIIELCLSLGDEMLNSYAERLHLLIHAESETPVEEKNRTDELDEVKVKVEDAYSLFSWK